MLTDIRIKIRALIEDFTPSDFETFTYNTSAIFTLAEANIVAIAKVLKNGTELGSGEYSYDSVTNKIEILVSLTNNDIIEVDYTYNKWSDSEIDSYVIASLVWISINSHDSQDYELEDEEIFPTPDNKTEDLISLVSAILIKPDYTEYKLPNRTVKYHKKMPKEDKIESLIMKYNMGSGVNDIISID